MEINQYYQPLRLQYSPIDFDTLYKVAAYQKEQIDKANENLSTQLKEWSKFQSPSEVDTQNWYKLTKGALEPVINEMVKNPDLMKSAEGRYKIQNAINSVDYGALSMLKSSAENLNKGLEMRAKMQAEGTYNKDWDDSNIAQYDTLGNKKVFSDISPVKFMTANQLSNPYFDNLKPGDLGSVKQGGVLYRVKGISENDLYQVATQRFNDLVNTPQGQKYMNQFMQQTGGDVEASKEAFIHMIAQSQMDRTLRPDLEVDPAFMLTLKASLDNANNQPTQVIPTRQQQIDYSVSGKVETNVLEQATVQDIEQINKLSKNSQNFAAYLKKLEKQYNSIKGTDEASQDQKEQIALKIANTRKYKADVDNQLNGYLYKQALNREFKQNTNVDIKDANKIDKADYNRGVEKALLNVAGTTALFENDPILTKIGGSLQQYTQTDGSIINAYTFGNSSGFLLPETVFQLSTGNKPVDNKRKAGMWRDSEFMFRELLESGQFAGVQFIPDATNNTIQMGSNKVLSGNLRISKKSIVEALGTRSPFLQGVANVINYPIGMLLSADTTKETMKKLFGAKVVEYGSDGDEYYDIKIWKQLPEDGELTYWNPVNELHLNSTSTPSGIGNATQAVANHPYSIQSIINNR